MGNTERFPDGTIVDNWFYDTAVPSLDELGKQYILTQHGITDDGQVYTAEIQALIDTAAENGGGVIVVPPGTFMTGALFFKQGVHLYVAEGGTLKGSDDIADYPVCTTRIEGETCRYYSALINADGINGFVMCGNGTIDGNGTRSWKAFWARRSWNPRCTNKDEQRARLVYISHCENVIVADLCLQNAQYWTNHIYRSHHVKFIGCRILSPNAPVKAPSTDAIDIDACTDVLIKRCYMAVNDDAVAFKGGKGPWADTLPENGSNDRVIIEDCEYGFCHGALTCGSEAIHCRNVIMRRIKVGRVLNLIWMKMRPDTPQRYEYITFEDIEGNAVNFITIVPWTQFYDLKDRTDIPLSYADRITVRNCSYQCDTFFHIMAEPAQYALSNFTFERLHIRAKNGAVDNTAIDDLVMDEVVIEPV